MHIPCWLEANVSGFLINLDCKELSRLRLVLLLTQASQRALHCATPDPRAFGMRRPWSPHTVLFHAAHPYPARPREGPTEPTIRRCRSMFPRTEFRPLADRRGNDICLATMQLGLPLSIQNHCFFHCYRFCSSPSVTNSDHMICVRRYSHFTDLAIQIHSITSHRLLSLP